MLNKVALCLSGLLFIGLTIEDLKRTMALYLTMAEGLKLAALTLIKTCRSFLVVQACLHALLYGYARRTPLISMRG
jgi:hypothetical protein